jgi:hypothetical protein
VNRHIQHGKLRSIKWANRYVRESDVMQVHFQKGRGTGHEKDWSEEGDVFLLLARGIGYSESTLSRTMAVGEKRMSWRRRVLHERGEIRTLLAKYGVEGLEYREEDGGLLTDWRAQRVTFPTVARAMDKFSAGTSLSGVEAECVRGLFWAWAAFHLGSRSKLAKRLSIVGRGARVTEARLAESYRALMAQGVDPLTGKCKEVRWKL